MNHFTVPISTVLIRQDPDLTLPQRFDKWKGFESLVCTAGRAIYLFDDFLITMSAHAEKFLRNMWMRVMLRGIHYGDCHSRLDQFYRLEDPWDMNNEAERFRFDTTNRLILHHFGRSKKLLEIGCGEGHQSEKLANICDKLIGIDVSRRAIQRAARRCARGLFAVGDVFTVPFLQSEAPFDLVVACEVLYYVKDVQAVITQMQRLGRSCFVTYLDIQHDILAPFLDALPGQQSEEFSYDATHWRAAWWPSRQPQFGC